MKPKHDLREIKGTYDELMKKENYAGTATDDFLHIILTNEDDVPDAMRKLKTVYPNILRLDYDNARTKSGGAVEVLPEAETKTPMELVSEFYAMQNGQPMNEAQSEYIKRLAETVWEEQA